MGNGVVKNFVTVMHLSHLISVFLFSYSAVFPLEQPVEVVDETTQKEEAEGSKEEDDVEAWTQLPCILFRKFIGNSNPEGLMQFMFPHAFKKQFLFKACFRFRNSNFR
jgi:hypothetical protein